MDLDQGVGQPSQILLRASVVQVRVKRGQRLSVEHRRLAAEQNELDAVPLE
jgi:hypothetical protein